MAKVKVQELIDTQKEREFRQAWAARERQYRRPRIAPGLAKAPGG